MPERIPVFEPELEEILVKVASNPDSLLLRGPQRGGVTAPLDLEEGVSARMAGLTITERHLLRVWRAEAAELLRQAFNLSLEAGPPHSARRVPIDFSNREVERSTTGVLAEKSRRLQFVARHREPKSALSTALHSLRSGLSIPRSSGRALIELSYRLRTSDQARICMALAAGEAGELEAALAMYASIRSTSPSREMQGYALCNATGTLAELGETKRMLNAAVEATQVAPNWAFSRLKHLTVLMDLGLGSQAVDAIHRLLDLGPAAQVMFEDQVNEHLAAVQKGVSEPTPELSRVVKLLCRQDCGQAREPLNRLALAL